MLTRPDSGERGSIAVWTAIFAIAVIALTALIIDGGIAMNARERATDIAGQAARAAVGDINPVTLRATGTAEIGPGACGLADELAARYAGLDSGGVDRVTSVHVLSCVAPVGSEVATVEVQITTQPLVGFLGGFTESGTQSATLQCGVDEGIEC
jgi:Flp pilus assembly protein TadG